MDWTRETHLVSTRRACRVLQFPSSTHYYRSRKPAREALRLRLKELAVTRPRFGYRRLHLLLRREGWKVNHKLVQRLYQEEGLQVRTRRRRKIASVARAPLEPASKPNERWSMDFVSDSFSDGRRFRLFAAVDQFSRECVAYVVGQSIRAPDVSAALGNAIRRRSKPAALTCDNGSESHHATWTAGRTDEGFISTSFGQEGRSRMRSSNPSTDVFEKSASACTGFRIWTTRRRPSAGGSGTTMRPGLTHRSTG